MVRVKFGVKHSMLPLDLRGAEIKFAEEKARFVIGSRERNEGFFVKFHRYSA